MKKLNIGVIGTGHLGNFHTKILKEIQEVNLVGVNDISMKAGEEISAKYDIPFIKDLDDVINRIKFYGGQYESI